MYVIGKGHEHEGPGTSMVQMIHWTPSQERQIQTGFGRGLGCACDAKKGLLGLGLFDSVDPSTWTMPEWGIAIFGGYMIMSTVFTTGRAVRTVGRTVSGGYRGARSGAREGGSRSGGSKKRGRY